MPEYSYQIVDSAGEVGVGVIDAPTKTEAAQKLRKDGSTIVDLSQQTSKPQRVYTPALKKIKLDDMLYLSNQLAVMVDTGVPLLEALDCISEQTVHTGLKDMVGKIADEIRAGSDFSSAISKYPKVFDEMYVSMIRASELSGTMGTMLERIASYQREQRDLRRQVKGAMMYPVGVLCFSVTVLVLMMIFILPRFEKIYSSKQAALPVATRVLLGASDVIVNHWIAIVCCAVAGIGGLVWWLKQPSGKLFVDVIKLKMPIVGPIFQKLYISRAFRTLSTMLTGGVEVLDAIAIAATVVGNKLHRDMWLKISDKLCQGNTLSEEMFNAPLIPRQMAQMVSSGDKSGRMADVMNRISDFCDSDIRASLKAATSMIEPIMIVTMGLIVGAIAMALLLPIFSINKVVG